MFPQLHMNPSLFTTAPHSHTPPTTSEPHDGHSTQSGDSIVNSEYGRSQYGHTPVGSAHVAWNVWEHAHLATTSFFTIAPKQMPQTSPCALAGGLRGLSPMPCIPRSVLNSSKSTTTIAAAAMTAMPTNVRESMHPLWANCNKSYASAPTENMFRIVTMEFCTRGLNGIKIILKI
jgi:hypothetical protein